jgi:hypothetical protein
LVYKNNIYLIYLINFLKVLIINKKVFCGMVSPMPVEVAARSCGCSGIEAGDNIRRGAHSIRAPKPKS